MKYVDPETGKVFEFELTPEELEACTKQPAMIEMFGSICKNQQDSKIKQLELRNDFSKSITNLVDHLVNAYLDYKEIQSSNIEEFLEKPDAETDVLNKIRGVSYENQSIPS